MPDNSVAVLIPAKDACSTIARAVASALAQPQAAEVVVVDDGSSDGTAAAARAADDGSGRLKVVSKANGGPGSAVNRGRDETTAPYFCVLDSDDFLLPNRLGRIFADAGHGWDMAADRLFLAEQGFEDGPYARWQGRTPASGRLSFSGFVRGNISDPRRPRTELGFLQPVFRRAFMDGAGLRHTEGLRLGEDYLAYATALARGAVFRVIPAYGYVAVARPNSLSRTHTADDLAALLQGDELLLAEAGLSQEDVDAVRAHMARLRREVIYRRALDAKAGGDLAGAIRFGLSDLPTFLYIAEQTARAKLGSGARARHDATRDRAAAPIEARAGF